MVTGIYRVIKNCGLLRSTAYIFKTHDTIFETACLRKSDVITRRDRVRNVDVYKRLKCIQTLCRRNQQRRLTIGLSWSHLADEQRQISTNGYRRIIGYIHGQLKRGRTKKRWIAVIKEDCSELGMTTHDVYTRSLKIEACGGGPLESC